MQVLGLQDDVADRTLAMLKGARAELSVGNPDRLSTDIGPVLHVLRFRRDGVHWPPVRICIGTGSGGISRGGSPTRMGGRSAIVGA